MWIIRWVFITALIITLVGFLGLNQNEIVNVNFFFWQSPPIPLALALFIAFAGGMFVQLLFAIIKQFQLRAEIGRQKRQVRRLQEELEKLRNLAIEEEFARPLNGSQTPIKHFGD
ncbi:MAG: LapA family protein [bacterium]|nr:LapA family protein [bacterium]